MKNIYLRTKLIFLKKCVWMFYVILSIMTQFDTFKNENEGLLFSYFWFSIWIKAFLILSSIAIVIWFLFFY
jgi:hypothetical protein